MLLAAARTASAQEATPESAATASWLFLQACESDVATSTNDSEGIYELVLQHASGQTLFFSDRPERVAGLAPTAAVLDAIEAVAGSITLRARIIEAGQDEDSDGAEGETIAPVTELPASVGQATLFIDDLGVSRRFENKSYGMPIPVEQGFIR